MEMLNKLVAELVPFAYTHKLNLLQILQVIDITMCNLEVDLEDKEQIDNFGNTMIHLNHLLNLLGESKVWEQEETMVKFFFNNEFISERLKAGNFGIVSFQNGRLAAYTKFNNEIKLIADGFVKK